MSADTAKYIPWGKKTACLKTTGLPIKDHETRRGHNLIKSRKTPEKMLHVHREPENPATKVDFSQKDWVWPLAINQTFRTDKC